jgi:hypothetical protein
VGLGAWWSGATGSEGAAEMAEEEQTGSGAGKKESKGERGHRQVGLAGQREGGRESAAGMRWGAGPSAGGGGGLSGAGRVREREGD